jgi:hypothetical protein
MKEDKAPAHSICGACLHPKKPNNFYCEQTGKKIKSHLEYDFQIITSTPKSTDDKAIAFFFGN